MADEGVHEIQLNGKQLVFLFMAATVVAVVIFLSGVMVGRGVRPARVDVATASSDAPVDPTTSVEGTSSRAGTADRAPVSTQEALTYTERLEAPEPPRETLKESAADAVTPPAPSVRDTAPPAVREPEPAAPLVEQASFAVPPGNGFVVQVGAYPKTTADAIAHGLSSKGYPTFIMPRDKGLFAVRVGKYSDRREAETVARRLETDEQFKKPWVTR